MVSLGLLLAVPAESLEVWDHQQAARITVAIETLPAALLLFLSHNSPLVINL